MLHIKCSRVLSVQGYGTKEFMTLLEHTRNVTELINVMKRLHI
jgi:hypothetical protein